MKDQGPAEAAGAKWAPVLLLLSWGPLLSLLTGRSTLIQHDYFTSDLQHGQFPLRWRAAARMVQGDLPGWEPDVYSGAPLFAQLDAAPLYLPNWILLGLPEPLLGLGWSVLFHVLLGAIGAWLLARRLGAGPVAAVVAGLAFSLSGWNVTHIKQLGAHAAAAWVPWVVLAGFVLERRRTGRAACVLGLALLVQATAGHPQVLYLTLLALAVVLAPMARSPKSAALAATAVVAGFVSASVLWVPAASIAADTGRGGDWQYVASAVWWLPDLWHFLVPNMNGAFETMDYHLPQGAAPPWSLPWESYGFLGVGVLVLGLSAPAWTRATGGAPRGLGRLGIVGAVSFLLMLGPATPLFRLAWLVVPGMKLFRFPQRFLLLVTLVLAVAAAVALTRLCTWLAARQALVSLARLLPLLVVLATALELTGQQARHLPQDDREAWRVTDDSTEWLAPVRDGGRVYVLDHWGMYGRAYQDAQGFEDPRPYRRVARAPIADRSLLMGLSHADGYLSFLDPRVAAFWQQYNRGWLEHRYRIPEFGDDGALNLGFLQMLRRAGVRWVVSPHPLRREGLRLVGSEPWGLYELDGAMPRAYVVDRWRPAGSLEEAGALLVNDLDLTPVIEGATPGPSPRGVGETVRARPVAVDATHDDLLRLRVSGPGWAVLTDSGGDGWSATLDGAPVAVHWANGWQRAVEIPAGDHVIEYTYAIPGLRLGALLSGFGLLVLGALGSGLRPRRR